MKKTIRLLGAMILLFATFLHNPISAKNIDLDNDLELFCQLKALTRNFVVGQTVKFEATIVNNGSQAIYNIDIMDFAPEGFVLSDSSHPNVALGSDKFVLNVKGPIKPGKEKKVRFEAFLTDSLKPGLYTNFCKIVHAENKNGEVLISEKRQWDSSPWSLKSSEALDFIRILEGKVEEKEHIEFAIIQTQLLQNSKKVQVDFADDNNGSITYRLFTNDDKLKSMGKVNTSEGLNSFTLDVSFMNSGLYTLEIDNGNDSAKAEIELN